MGKRAYKRQNVKRDALICQWLRAGGATMAGIARELSLTVQRVRQIALREGITAATYKALLPPSKTQTRAAQAEAARQNRREKKTALIARIMELHKQGLSQTAISRIIGRSQVTVSRIMIAAGHRIRNVPIRVFREKKRRALKTRVDAPSFVPASQDKQAEHPPETIRAALELWRKGLSAQRIALRLNSEERTFTKNVIIGIAHRNNFPPRPSPLRRSA